MAVLLENVGDKMLSGGEDENGDGRCWIVIVVFVFLINSGEC